MAYYASCKVPTRKKIHRRRRWSSQTAGHNLYSVFGAPEAAAKNTTARRTGLTALVCIYIHTHTSMSKYSCATRMSCTRPIRFVCVVELFSCRKQGISAAYGGWGGWNAIFSVPLIIVEPRRWWRVVEVSIAASVHPTCAYGLHGR